MGVYEKLCSIFDILTMDGLTRGSINQSISYMKLVKGMDGKLGLKQHQQARGLRRLCDSKNFQYEAMNTLE